MTPFTRIPFRYCKTIWIAVVLLTAVGIAGIFRVTWVQDISSLLPRKDDGLISLAREWGMMKTVTVVVGPTKMGDDALHDTLDTVIAETTALSDVASVTGRIAAENAMETVSLLSSRAGALYRPEGVAALSLAEIRARLESTKKRLAAPEALMTASILLADPLGFGRRALVGLEAAGAAMGAVVDKGHLLSANRQYGLVLLTLAFDPMEVSRAASFIGKLDRTLEAVSKAQGVPVFALGGVHHAAATAGVMKREITQMFILTAVLVLAVFAFFFRSIRMLPPALLPSAVGIGFALGVLGFLHIPVHAVTVGFAATIGGISIDYVIHLLYRAGVGGGTTEERMSRAVRDIAEPVTLGFLTTVGAFAVIAFSGFTGIRQIAVFSLISIPTAFFVALFAIPSLHRFLLERHAESGGEPPHLRWASRWFERAVHLDRRWVRAVFAILVVVATVAASRITFSGDPRDLGYIDAELRAREQTFRRVFPGLFEQVMIVSSGSTMQDALLRNDSLYDALISAGVPAGEIISLSPFLPSAKTQRQAASNAQRALAGPLVDGAFSTAGFEEDYLAALREKTAQAGRTPLIPNDFEHTSLSELLAKSIHLDAAGKFHCLTRVRAANDAAMDRLASIASGAGGRLVSERLETRETLLRLQQEIVVMLAVWLWAAVGAVSLARRSLRFGLRAALPALFGVAAATAVFALTGRPLTAVASAGITLVMGLSVDYGIFMQSTGGRGAETAGAVAASALTTIAGFGVLAATSIRAMADIGLIILVGISVAALTALLLVPALMPSSRNPSNA